MQSSTADENTSQCQTLDMPGSCGRLRQSYQHEEIQLAILSGSQMEALKLGRVKSLSQEVERLD